MGCFFSFSFVFLVLGVCFTLGCFITNCPPGGKRSIPDGDIKKMKIRECASCGPEGRGGRCFGPTTCCSPEFGCLIGTPETFICLLENRVNAACHNPGLPCKGSRESGTLKGICAAERTCCSPDTCEVDDTCHFDEPKQQVIPHSSSSMDSDADQKSTERDHFIVPIAPPAVLVNRFKLSYQRDLDKRNSHFDGGPRQDY